MTGLAIPTLWLEIAFRRKVGIWPELAKKGTRFWVKCGLGGVIWVARGWDGVGWRRIGCRMRFRALLGHLEPWGLDSGPFSILSGIPIFSRIFLLVFSYYLGSAVKYCLRPMNRYAIETGPFAQAQ